MEDLPKFPETEPKKKTWKQVALSIVFDLMAVVLMIIVLLLLWYFTVYPISVREQYFTNAAIQTITINSSSARLLFRAIDDKSDTLNITVYLNGFLLKQLVIMNNSQVPIDFNVPFQPESYLEIQATDESGNKGVTGTNILFTDNRPPEFAVAVKSVNKACVTKLHIEPIPCPPDYFFEYVGSNYASASSTVFNHTIKKTMYDSKIYTYDAIAWSTQNTTSVYVELMCRNYQNNNWTFRLKAYNPNNFTYVVSTSPVNYSAVQIMTSWVKWC